MTNERVEQIEQAIAAVEAQGQRWSNASIYAQGGGRYADLSQYLKQRRAHRRGGGGGGGGIPGVVARLEAAAGAPRARAGCPCGGGTRPTGARAGGRGRAGA